MPPPHHLCYHHFQNWANLSSDFSFQRENSEARLTFLLREGGWLTRSDLLEMVTSLANALPQAAKLPSSYYLAEFVGSELVNSLFQAQIILPLEDSFCNQEFKM